MHKLSSRLLVLSCSCLIILSVLSFSFSAEETFPDYVLSAPSFYNFSVSSSVLSVSFSNTTLSYANAIVFLAPFESGDSLVLSNIVRTGSSPRCTLYYNGELVGETVYISGSSYTITFPSTVDAICFWADQMSFDVSLPFGNEPIIPPETAPPEYGDMLGMMTSGFSTVSGIWQGVIDLVASNWLLVVGLVCFIAVFAISSIRRHYRS